MTSYGFRQSFVIKDALSDYIKELIQLKMWPIVVKVKDQKTLLSLPLNGAKMKVYYYHLHH